MDGWRRGVMGVLRRRTGGRAVLVALVAAAALPLSGCGSTPTSTAQPISDAAARAIAAPVAQPSAAEKQRRAHEQAARRSVALREARARLVSAQRRADASLAGRS